MPKPHLPETLAPDLLERLRTRFHPWELIRDWGLTLDSVEPGRAVMRLVPSRCVVNGPRGNVNGGVLASMADLTGAVAVSTAFDSGMTPSKCSERISCTSSTLSISPNFTRIGQ